MKKIAVMQPTYRPWAGYFSLMSSVDHFILLDDVQFSRRSWQQRNQIKTSSGPRWLTVPVLSKGQRSQLINQVQIDPSSNYSSDHLEAIRHSYLRSPFFPEYFPSLSSTLVQHHKLVDLNVSLILFLKELLGIATPVTLSSTIATSGHKADLMASICVSLGATHYVSAEGSRAYLESSEAFSGLGIPVSYFNFHVQEYSQQFPGFSPNMSVIDMLMNCGRTSTDLIALYTHDPA